MAFALTAAKRFFYRHFPSAHVSAFVRTIHLKTTLRRLTFQEALDAGCGEGEYTLFLAERFPRARFTGFDISEGSIRKASEEAARRGISNVSFRVMDLKRMEESGRYDFVFTLECLEHIPGNRPVIDGLIRALKKGGTLLIMMPNEKIHRYLFPRRWFEKYNQWAAAEHIGDQYTLEELTALLRTRGIRVIRSRYTFGFWGKLVWEVRMLTEEKRGLHCLLLPLLLLFGILDSLWPFWRSGSYGLLVLGRKE